LLIERDRVMHGRRDAGVGELGLQCFAVLDQDGVLGEDTGAVGLGPWKRFSMDLHG
jgi:hypothetical protein